MLSLKKGEKISLAKVAHSGLTRVVMGLGWDAKTVSRLFGLIKTKRAIDLDASCLVFDNNGRNLEEVWFRNLLNRNGSIRHTGDNRTGDGDGDDEQIIVDLDRLPKDAKTLIFTVNSWTGETFDDVNNAFCRLVDDETNKEIARYSLSDSGPHTGMIMAKLSRGPQGWEMTAIGDRAEGRSFHDMMEAIKRHVG